MFIVLLQWHLYELHDQGDWRGNEGHNTRGRMVSNRISVTIIDSTQEDKSFLPGKNYSVDGPSLTYF